MRMLRDDSAHLKEAQIISQIIYRLQINIIGILNTKRGGHNLATELRAFR
jgi:hypothetical protein